MEPGWQLPYGKLPKGRNPNQNSPGIFVGEQRRLENTSSEESILNDTSSDRSSEKKSFTNEPACVNLHRWESSLQGSGASTGLKEKNKPTKDKTKPEERTLSKQNSQASFLKTVRGGSWFRRDKRLSWDEYFKVVGPLEFSRSPHTRELVRRYGIPAAYRGVFWKILSSSDELKDGDISYSVIVNNYSQTDPEVLDQIEKDLNRTFPDDSHFHGENADGIFALRRILSSYACFDSELGYCQSMNFIVALMLLFMSEEDAFWTLVTIIQRILPHDYYQSMFGVRVDIHTFCSLLALRSPKVWHHMESLGVDRSVIQGIVLPWFLCLYVNVLPLEATLRFFDAFFFEGDKVLFRVALALFRLHEKHILATSSMTDCIQVICHLTQNIDPDLIMDTAFDTSLLGRLNRAKIAALRVQHEREISEKHPQLFRTRSPNSRRPLGLRNAAPLRAEPPVSPRNHESTGAQPIPSPPIYSSPSPPFNSSSSSSSSSSSASPSPSPIPSTPPSTAHMMPAPDPPSLSTKNSIDLAPPRPISSPAPSPHVNPRSSPTPALLSAPPGLPRGIPPRSKSGTAALGNVPSHPAPPIPYDFIPLPSLDEREATSPTSPLQLPPIDLLPRRMSVSTQEPPRSDYFYRAHPSRKPLMLPSPGMFMETEPNSSVPLEPQAPPSLDSIPVSALEELDPRYSQRYSRLSILVGRFSAIREQPFEFSKDSSTSQESSI